MALRIDVQLDNRELLRRLPKYEKRLVFGTQAAVNRTLLRMQRGVHESTEQKLIIRRRRFFFGTPARPGGVAGKILFASVRKQRIYGELYVDARGSKGGPVLLPLFETGGTRRPHTPGAKQIAVPRTGGPARPNIAREVPPRFTVKGLKLRAYVGKAGSRFGVKRARRRRRGGAADVSPFSTEGRFVLPDGGRAVSWRGEERTFIIPEEGIYQRIGPGQRDIRPVYPFIEPFQLDEPKLEFVSTATHIANEWFAEEWQRELTSTLTRVRR